MELVLQARDLNDTEFLCTTCPFCGDVSGFPCSLVVDYASSPMFWCDACWARAFLDATEDELIDLDNDEPVTRFREVCDRTYAVPLLKIHEVVNNDVAHYVADLKLTSEEVTEFFAALSAGNDYEIKYNGTNEQKDACHKTLEGLMRKYSITAHEDDIGDPDADLDFESMFNLALPVDSYNTRTPVRTYPPKYELQHDGICVYCKLDNGRVVWYWGD